MTKAEAIKILRDYIGLTSPHVKPSMGKAARAAVARLRQRRK